MFSIKKEVSDIKRFNEIVLILLEEEFGYILDKIKIRLPLSKKIKAKIRKTTQSPEQRLRETFERLGPTFIKLGQLLSVRPDLVPLSYISELEKLQDNIPSFSFDKVEEILLREFKKPIKNIFLKFEQKPFASASISQVHRAILRNGTKVAVKIQRPNIIEIIHKDIELMFFFARLIEKHVSELRKYRPITIVNEFAEWTKRELDFRVEARNAQVFREMFKENKSVHIPEVYPEYTTSSVLTLEYLNGVPIHQLNKLRKKKWFNITKLMNNGFNAMLTQIYINGFFHADPHPSNILILKNNVVGFVDFGIVGYFDKKLRNLSAKLFSGIIEHDADKVVDAMMGMGKLDKEIDIDNFRFDVSKTIFEIQAGSEIKDVKISLVLEKILDISLDYGFRMPKEFVLFGKTLITLEGVALEYSPRFRVLDASKPFMKKLARREFQPAHIISDVVDNIVEFKRFFSVLPHRLDNILEKIQRGTVKIDIEDTDIKTLAVEIDKSSNRLSYGMLISALLVTGGLVMEVKMPLIYGVPVISFICFSLASLIGLMLFVSILREDRFKK